MLHSSIGEYLNGITPVIIDDPRVALQPQIKAPETWQPESTVSFTVSEASGRPMAYTVAAVDDGLLGLTRFNLPNPRGTFYAKEASFLKSWDLFRDIIGAYSGRLETLLAIGGGGDEILAGSKETQRFKPVVRFFGPYEIGSREQKTETFDLPPYIGSLRIMVLAASATNEAQNRSQRAYGTAEQSVKVASDLMVFGSLPRTLSPGDEAIIPVYVNSYSGGRRTVKVNLCWPLPAGSTPGGLHRPRQHHNKLAPLPRKSGGTPAGASSPSSLFRYQDIRDDRVMTYFNLNRSESRTISFTVNKTYEGSYFRPAIHAYAMYDESIRALIPGVR